MEAEDIEELIPIIFCFGMGLTTLILAFLLKNIQRPRIIFIPKSFAQITQTLNYNELMRNQIELFKEENDQNYLDFDLEKKSKKNENQNKNNEMKNIEKTNNEEQNFNENEELNDSTIQILNPEILPCKISPFQNLAKSNQISPNQFNNSPIYQITNNYNDDVYENNDFNNDYLPNSIRKINKIANENYNNLYKNIQLREQYKKYQFAMKLHESQKIINKIEEQYQQEQSLQQNKKGIGGIFAQKSQQTALPPLTDAFKKGIQESLKNENKNREKPRLFVKE